VGVPTVRFAGRARAVEVPRGERLTDAIRAAGLPIAAPCGDDLICGRCGVRILHGRVGRESPVERDAKRRNRIDPALRLACAIRVHHDLEVSADYWGDTRCAPS
jgi:ferredoxin